MIKKQLGVLAGAMLLASGSHAAIVAGTSATDSSALLVLNSAAGSYIIDTGISAGDLAAGIGFSVDISGALSSGSLGAITGYALIGALACDDPGCTGAAGYAEAGMGYVAAGGTNPLLAADLLGIFNGINTYIGNTSAGGFFAAGTLDNLDNNPWALANTLTQGAGAVTQIFTSTETAVSPDGVVNGPVGGNTASIIGSNFVVSAVPVPAAAWLFGSALLGLGVVRRKS